MTTLRPACDLKSTTEAMSRDRPQYWIQVIVGILLATSLKEDTLSEGVGVAIIIVFCLFALGFAWWVHPFSEKLQSLLFRQAPCCASPQAYKQKRQNCEHMQCSISFWMAGSCLQLNLHASLLMFKNVP